MKNLIFKDIKLLISYKGNIVFTIVFVPFLLFMSNLSFSSPYLYMTAVVSFAYLVSTMSFSYDIPGNSQLLARSLPVTKQDIVLAKYIFAIFAFVVSTLVSGIFLNIAGMITGMELITFDLALALKSLVLLLVAISFAMPLFFVLPKKIATFFNIFIFVFLMNSFTISVSDLDSVFQSGFFTSFGGMLGLAVGILLVTTSAALSVKLYVSRD